MSKYLPLLLSLLDGSSNAKTYLAGAGLIGLGLYQLSQSDPESAFKSFALGLGLFGIGHKQSTAADEVIAKVSAPVVEPTPKA
jgi:hypothetical protein